MRGIVWFRRDLRVSDQPALTAACGECDEVIPLFVFDEPLLQSHAFGSACVNFMLGCLQDVAASLASRGITLQWRHGEPVKKSFKSPEHGRQMSSIGVVTMSQEPSNGTVSFNSNWRRSASSCEHSKTMLFSRQKKFGARPASRCSGTVPIAHVGGRSGRRRNRPPFQFLGC